MAMTVVSSSGVDSSERASSLTRCGERASSSTRCGERASSSTRSSGTTTAPATTR
jgi:hypothetical protein